MAYFRKELHIYVNMSKKTAYQVRLFLNPTGETFQTPRFPRWLPNHHVVCNSQGKHCYQTREKQKGKYNVMEINEVTKKNRTKRGCYISISQHHEFRNCIKSNP